ncbi:hypothetical protein LCGC14_3034470 [marine sediment metagenome]|uniref:Uncharacterized protein n=1 Tax=marine sediment metagenome TaxID=412755 RepID=A0A0F8XER1_9ZZZZ
MVEPGPTASTEPQLLKIDRCCSCFAGKRRPPLRLRVSVMVALRNAAKGGVADIANQTLLTYRCADCGEVVNITLRDLYLA